MGTQSLDRIFKPQRIALIGASPNPRSVSGTVLRNLVGSGFRGVVYPVAPGQESVLGVQCWPDLGSVPRVPDLAVVCTPPEQVPGVVRACGEAGVGGALIVSAGFRETGAAGRALEEQVRAEARRFEGLRVVGPNCLGFIVPALGLNVTFAQGMPKPGSVAFISQSGALCTAVLDWALDQGIGFSYFASVGNMLDVDFGDLIDYFGEDEKTRSILLYVESLGRARHFLSAARAFARSKPIVAYKAGRFPESAQAAASHTGAMASEDEVFDAAFARAGIVRVYEIADIFHCAELVGRHPAPAGPRLGIVTNAGGPGVMAVDALVARRGALAELAPATLEQLNESLPPAWSHANPVDVLGDANSKRFAKAAALTLADPGVDALLAILTPQAMTNPTATARELGALTGSSRKPILAAWMGGSSMREGAQILSRAGVATYGTPAEAVQAFMTLVAYARDLEALYETPRDIPVEFPLDRQELRARFASLLPAEGEMLSEAASKAVLEAYGIPVTRPTPAADADAAVRAAQAVGYPVVLKLDSPDITHKSDVGGVALDLADAAAVRSAFGRIVDGARAARPGARVAGVTVQRMVRSRDGIELILGSRLDPVFGAVLLVGMGGIAAEVVRDRVLGLPPLNERLARGMLESLRAWPLLQGYRGRAGVDVDRLIETLMRFSYLVADYPEIRELDVNPLLAAPGEVVALDARIRVDRAHRAEPGRPYAHLALRPYPEELVRRVRLRGGEALTLRPIRPEDEPHWMAMLGSCSRETIYMRFRYMFQWADHRAATRYCYTDYDREIAMVAEREDGGEPRLVGVGRLVADPDHQAVEYAVLVSDAWQNRGLGGVLTDACMEIARGWGLRRMVAQTTSDNARMLALFEKRGFAIEPGEEGIMECSRELRPA
ncbi:MAG TPA: GNAT family N-acetyltransferase [Candidatus Saccharimonadales bacterium]|nr:GNAT family N-acetyltransferase [Candidatus Saccharimonadales bacterium]